jgi:HAD superfamily hydrolase (TIGR01484 family)
MKLIVCDIDDTLIDSPEQKLPSQKLVDAIRSVKEHALVACATGRAKTWALPVLQAAHFTAPCIVAGGTVILDPDTYDILHEKHLPKSQLENIKNILREYPDLRVCFNDYDDNDYLSGGWEMERLLASPECSVIQAIWLGHQRAEELVARFRHLRGVTSVKMTSQKPGLADIHIIPEGATKEHAIHWLQEKLDIPKEDTIGIGDGYNDLHIFKAVGTKIALANANEDLKKRADIIIGDVHDDAVADFLLQYTGSKLSTLTTF